MVLYHIRHRPYQMASRPILVVRPRLRILTPDEINQRYGEILLRQQQQPVPHDTKIELEESNEPEELVDVKLNLENKEIVPPEVIKNEDNEEK